MSDVIKLTPRPLADKPGYCEIMACREAHELFKACQRMSQIGLMVGRTGTGKTTAAKTFKASNSDVTYVRVTTAANTVQPFLVKLCEALGAYTQRHLGKAALETMVLDSLASFMSAKKLIIVDEMNHATGELVHLIRDIWDTARCGIVLVGTPEMEDLWSERAGRKGGRDDGFAAFRARIGARVALDSPSAGDITALCRHHGIEGKPEREVVTKLVRARDGLHNFEHLLANAREIAGAGQPMTGEHLLQGATLMGARI